MVLELIVAQIVDLVVGLDILLDSLTARSIALLQVDDGILNHIDVRAMARSSGSSLLRRGSGGLLGRHSGSNWVSK
jgi:hypothetical protein